MACYPMCGRRRSCLPPFLVVRAIPFCRRQKQYRRDTPAERPGLQSPPAATGPVDSPGPFQQRTRGPVESFRADREEPCASHVAQGRSTGPRHHGGIGGTLQHQLAVTGLTRLRTRTKLIAQRGSYETYRVAASLLLFFDCHHSGSEALSSLCRRLRSFPSAPRRSNLSAVRHRQFSSFLRPLSAKALRARRRSAPF